MTWDLFAICDLCNRQRVILGHIKVYLDGKKGETTKFKCLGCNHTYFYWNGKRYIIDGKTYNVESIEKVDDREVVIFT